MSCCQTGTEQRVQSMYDVTAPSKSKGDPPSQAVFYIVGHMACVPFAEVNLRDCGGVELMVGNQPLKVCGRPARAMTRLFPLYG